MPTTTPNLGLTKPDIGSTDWGTAVNTNWDTIDSAFGGGGANGQCRLEYVSATSIKLIRYNGKYLLINGAFQAVPSSGVTLTNSGLSASTLYYIYAYMSSGTMTLTASTSTPTAHSTYGNQVNSGDNTQSLVGMARTNGSSQFVDSETQRFLRSWFCEGRIVATQYGHNVGTTSSTYVEISSSWRVEFITWAGENVAALVMGGADGTSQGVETCSRLWLDSNQPSGQDRNAQPHTVYRSNTGYGIIFSNVSVGYHYVTLAGMLSGGGGTATYYSISTAVFLKWRQ